MSDADVKRQLSLGVFLAGAGHHVASWRHPHATSEARLFEHYLRVAREAERACFDAVFFADSLAVEPGALAHGLGPAAALEPLTTLAALAAVTTHIGLIATATTTYNEPYHVARKFASLDSISGGRAGWNLVTSDNAAEAGNFGRDAHVVHADRYQRAAEFHEVVTGLWNSWEDDAIVRDRASGQYFDPQKVHRLGHRGAHFGVAGPLNVARSAQGHPVVVQAGSSEAGRELAARTAEVVFTAQPNLAAAQAFYADLKARVARHGRAPGTLKIMPGVFAVVGASDAEAQEKHEQLQALVHPQLGLGLLGRMIGNFDLSAYPLDGPLPELPQTETGQRSRQQLFTELARGENLTIRQLYLRIAGGRGHFTVIGSGRTVADRLQEWFEAGAADGFNLMPPVLPDGLDDFVAQVIPELRRRGLFRTCYQGTTLRAHLGLPYPVNRNARKRTSSP
ncbi:LLM class flavin-dependent oxidoreductase [Solimonas soli]|uniref:LLM class flavin-dependent oxidoreductase n=1 Tax=Solimonas soli TaxID=413479 RepID=UPI000481D356|nr:LLM class flavin-dependent oxidoreductase [Solimonas soli]